MNMATVELSLYEALTEAGVKPDAARNVERQVEGAITRSQEAARVQMHQQLMTKADGAELKAELKGDIAQAREELKGDITQVQQGITQVRAELKDDISKLRSDMHDLVWKMVMFFIAINGIMFAAFKYLG